MQCAHLAHFDAAVVKEHRPITVNHDQRRRLVAPTYQSHGYDPRIPCMAKIPLQKYVFKDFQN